MDMNNSARLRAILAAIAATGQLADPRHVPRVLNDDSEALEGEIALEGKTATLRIVLDETFPLRLPRVFLQPWDAFGMIPHVSLDGLVCYADSEGLVLDRRRPTAVVEEVLRRALIVVADGARGRNHGDFADEWESYWRLLEGGIAARSLLEPAGPIRWARVAMGKEGRPVIVDGEATIAAFLNGRAVGGEYTLQRALYLPLSPSASLVPPHPKRPFWSIEEARRALLSALCADDRRHLWKLLKGRTRAREYVIAGLARPSGGTTLFGLRFDGVGACHPLLAGGTAERMIPIQLERLDRGYLIPRGGGEPTLMSKRILLVGCGAVGGHIAFELARAGMLDLTLVDPELLTPENTFRHVLGREYWGTPKASALKETIEASLPYTTVRAVTTTIEHGLADGTIELADYDLVVMALGNPTVELAINERLHMHANMPIGILTWLEPFGIGGHALLVGNAREGGCFECLYRSPDAEAAPLANRASFAAPGQVFGRALSGCGSLFTPYGSLDASRTAGLAVRLAVDALRGGEAGNPLLSWKGDSTDIEAAGFALSPRYDRGDDDLYRLRYAYRATDCPVCGAASTRGSR